MPKQGESLSDYLRKAAQARAKEYKEKKISLKKLAAEITGGKCRGRNSLLRQKRKLWIIKLNRERLLDIGDPTWHEGYEQLYEDWDVEVERLGREMSSAEFKAFLGQRRGELFGGPNENMPVFTGLNISVLKQPMAVKN